MAYIYSFGPKQQDKRSRKVLALAFRAAWSEDSERAGAWYLKCHGLKGAVSPFDDVAALQNGLQRPWCLKYHGRKGPVSPYGAVAALQKGLKRSWSLKRHGPAGRVLGRHTTPWQCRSTRRARPALFPFFF